MASRDPSPADAEVAPAGDPARGPDLALDLLNTLGPIQGSEADRLRTPSDLLAWLDTRRLGNGRLASLRASPAEATLLLAEARRLRDESSRALEALTQRGTLSPDAVYGIDRLLQEGSVSRRLRVDAGRPELVEELTGTSLVATLAPVALSTAHLLTSADPSRVRRCAASDCGAWFLDTSKGGRRKWCSMTACGNRAKAARHRRKGRSR